MQSSNIQFGFECKMIQLGSFTQPFQLDVSTQGSKQMVGLSSDRLSGRFMVGFHVPSFTIDGGHLVGGQGGIAGHQIENPRATIFVCEDLFDQQEREIEYRCNCVQGQALWCTRSSPLCCQ